MRGILFAAIFLLSIFTISTFLNTAAEFSTRQNNICKNFVSVNDASGFVINKTDKYIYVLTAFHVVNGEAHISYPIYAGKSLVGFLPLLSKTAEIMESNKELDYAILKVPFDDTFEAKNFASVEVSTEISIEDRVLAVGRPKGYFWQSQGIVAANMDKGVGHTAGVYYGSSGGPLYNSSYRVIALNSSMNVVQITEKKYVPVGFIGFSVRISDIIQDLGYAKTKEYFGVVR